MATDDINVLAIAGPTASGKSALALDLAEARGGVVVNADSMQVYGELRILTARPGQDALTRAPHRLYGILPAAQACSAARWRRLALAEIAAAHGDGRLPILAGGTGLYLRALIEGLSPVPDIADDIRAEATARHAALGGERFRAELALADPQMAARLHAGDTQRLIRAWEVIRATGRSLADWQSQPRVGAPEGLRFAVIVLDPPRHQLYAACDGRFLRMIDDGAVEEVRALAALGLPPGLPAMKALGVPELRGVLDGRLTLAAAVAGAQTATRRYAKRQSTWFRHQRPRDAAGLRRWTVIPAQYSESTAHRILSDLCRGN